MTVPSPDSERSRAGARLSRFAPLLFESVGVAALLVAGYQILQKTQRYLEFYDEGIVLSHTLMVSWGRWPYRDFYTQYPPGIFLLLLTLWKLFGTKVLVARFLSHGLRVGVALMAGVAGARTVGRRFSALPAGLVLLFLARLPPSPSAWLAGLMFALASVVALSRAVETSERGPWLVAGAMLGLTLSFRHDLFVYFVAALSPCVLLWVHFRTPTREQALRLFGWTAAGAAIPIAFLWVPTLVVAKWSVIAHDGLIDQVRYVMPGRKLPVPSLTELVLLPPLTTTRLPAFLTDMACMTYAIVLWAPALGLLQTLGAERSRGDRVTALLLTALSVAVLPQATGRADWIHAIYALTPGLILASSFAMSSGQFTWRNGLAAILLSAFCVWALRAELPPHGPLFAEVSETQLDGSPYTQGIPDPQAATRRQLRAYVQSHSAPGEPIYIGTSTHSTIMVNEVDLYFVLDRPAATRYLQFDVGTVTRAEVQAQMIASLEAQRTHMVILAHPPSWVEVGNDSGKPGATILDSYLRSRYETAAKIGPYEVRLRKSN
jgi:hypothetical protein